jgi:probable rRNA maturation factor
MVEIINRQRGQRVQPTTWKQFAERAIEVIGARQDAVTIVLVSDAAMRKLNRQFRGKDNPTDVLSFPAAPEPFEKGEESSLGEIVISVETAGRQAKENGLSFSSEIQQLILHGLLHLNGYDHETDNGEMNRLELKLRKELEV